MRFKVANNNNNPQYIITDSRNYFHTNNLERESEIPIEYK